VLLAASPQQAREEAASVAVIEILEALLAAVEVGVEIQLAGAEVGVVGAEQGRIHVEYLH